MIDVKPAVQMIDLMLHAGRPQPDEVPLLDLAPVIEETHGDGAGPLDPGRDAGQIGAGLVMAAHLHAGMQHLGIGHPHRLAAFHDAMDYICSHDKVWKATGREIAQHYLDKHYDDALASMAAINAEDAA